MNEKQQLVQDVQDDLPLYKLLFFIHRWHCSKKESIFVLPTWLVRRAHTINNSLCGEKLFHACTNIEKFLDMRGETFPCMQGETFPLHLFHLCVFS